MSKLNLTLLQSWPWISIIWSFLYACFFRFTQTIQSFPFKRQTNVFSTPSLHLFCKNSSHQMSFLLTIIIPDCLKTLLSMLCWRGRDNFRDCFASAALWFCSLCGLKQCILPFWLRCILFISVLYVPRIVGSAASKLGVISGESNSRSVSSPEEKRPFSFTLWLISG